MTCEALINQFLMDYNAGTLPLARKLEFEFHLTLCSACRKYVDSYRKTIALAKNAAPPPPSEAAPAELIDAILKVTSGEKRGR